MRSEERYAQWKSLVPILYDWLANHNLEWPSLSCRWGPQLDQGTYKSRQRIYLTEHTDGSCPNTLVVSNCEVVKPRVAAAEHISQFNGEARSPFVKKHKTIFHPGEVNRIRELPQNSKIVATHTDSPEVLSGHTENAEFALALSPTSPLVLSGGKDAQVLLWSIEDQLTAGKDISRGKPATSSGGRHTWNSGGSASACDNTPYTSPSVIGLQGVFIGHTATVEEVQFRPSNSQEFCSVGDNSSLILWDARAGTSPATKVNKPEDESYRRMKGHNPPPGFFFQHAGHRVKVVDFHWDPCDPWTLSVSNDCDTPGGGGTLQIWRMNDMIYRPEEEVLAEIWSVFPKPNSHSAATSA